MRHQLKPIAASQRRTADCLNQILFRTWRLIVVNRRWAAGKDQTFWLMRLNLICGRVEGQNLGIHSCFADASRNELSVLRAKVEYDYSFVIAVQKRDPHVPLNVKTRNELRESFGL